jgi:hypothetical protein
MLVLVRWRRRPMTVVAHIPRYETARRRPETIESDCAVDEKGRGGG